MSDLISTKPYMVRAIHEWCIDNDLTPYLIVQVNAQTRVPKAYVKDGEIILNISYNSTKDLHIDNDAIVFSARFGGVAQNLYVPIGAVKGIVARENGQGMFFDIDEAPQPSVSSEAPSESASGEIAEDTAENAPEKAPEKKKPTLTVVK